MNINEIVSMINLKKEHDSVQKGVNCAVLTFLLYNNINILRNYISTNLDEFNKYTMVIMAEFGEQGIKLYSRDLNHEVVINTTIDPNVALLKLCIAMYGQLSIVSEIMVHARSTLIKLYNTQQLDTIRETY